MEDKVDIIDKRTETYPRLYDNIDKLIGEITENRQERAFISRRVQNHENRLSDLEKHFWSVKKFPHNPQCYIILCMPNVILVDENDSPIGEMEKLEAHKKKRLHRAFSIFIFNDQKQLMLQQRALDKYHSGGLWTNTVCSHPAPGEETIDAAHRRLQEEMGFDTDLKEIFTFSYKREFSNGLTENEYDHVFVGRYNDAPTPNPEEAETWKWATKKEISEDLQKNPDKYTYWFCIAFPKVIDRLH